VDVVDVHSPAIVQVTGAKRAITFTHGALFEGVMGFAAMSDWGSQVLERQSMQAAEKEAVSEAVSATLKMLEEESGQRGLQVNYRSAMIRKLVSFEGETLQEAVDFFTARHVLQPFGCFQVSVPLPPTFGEGLFFLLSSLYLGFKVYVVSPAEFDTHPLPCLFKTLPGVAGGLCGSAVFRDMRALSALCKELEKDADMQAAAARFASDRLGLWGRPPTILTHGRLTDMRNFVKFMQVMGGSFVPSYGVPECFGFVTGKRRGAASNPLRVVTIDKRTLATKGRIHLVRKEQIDHSSAAAAGSSSTTSEPSPGDMNDQHHVLVSCGHPLEGTEVRIVDPATNREVQGGQHGIIFVASKSLAMAYYRDQDGTETTLRQTFIDRSGDESPPIFLRTADIGFMHGGQLFLLGSVQQLLDCGSGRMAFHRDIVSAVKSVRLPVSWSDELIAPESVCAVTLDESDNRYLRASKEGPRVDCLQVAVIVKMPDPPSGTVASRDVQPIAFGVEYAIRTATGIRAALVQLTFDDLPLDECGRPIPSAAKDMLLKSLADTKSATISWVRFVENLQNRKMVQGISVDWLHVCMLDLLDEMGDELATALQAAKPNEGRRSANRRVKREKKDYQIFIRRCAERLEREDGLPRHKVKEFMDRFNDEVKDLSAFVFRYLHETQTSKPLYFWPLSVPWSTS